MRAERRCHGTQLRQLASYCALLYTPLCAERVLLRVVVARPRRHVDDDDDTSSQLIIILHHCPKAKGKQQLLAWWYSTGSPQFKDNDRILGMIQQGYHCP